MNSPALRSPQHGVTMLEVLIAIVVLSFGMLGLLGLLTNGLKMTSSSQYRTIAAQQFDCNSRHDQRQFRYLLCVCCSPFEQRSYFKLPHCYRLRHNCQHHDNDNRHPTCNYNYYQHLSRSFTKDRLRPLEAGYRHAPAGSGRRLS